MVRHATRHGTGGRLSMRRRILRHSFYGCKSSPPQRLCASYTPRPGILSVPHSACLRRQVARPTTLRYLTRPCSAASKAEKGETGARGKAASRHGGSPFVGSDAESSPLSLFTGLLCTFPVPCRAGLAEDPGGAECMVFWLSPAPTAHPFTSITSTRTPNAMGGFS